jgi:hypothetical protein
MVPRLARAAAGNAIGYKVSMTAAKRPTQQYHNEPLTILIVQKICDRRLISQTMGSEPMVLDVICKWDSSKALTNHRRPTTSPTPTQ